MKQRVAGFILIQWMVYFLLLTMLSWASFSWMRSHYMRLKAMHQTCDTALSLFIASDLLIKDVQQAQTIQQARQKDACRLKTGAGDVAFVIEDSKLYRIAGSYDPVKTRWRKKTKSLLATDVGGMQVTYEKNNGAQKGCNFIKVHLEQKKPHAKILDYGIALRNGSII